MAQGPKLIILSKDMHVDPSPVSAMDQRKSTRWTVPQIQNSSLRSISEHGDRHHKRGGFEGSHLPISLNEGADEAVSMGDHRRHRSIPSSMFVTPVVDR